MPGAGDSRNNQPYRVWVLGITLVPFIALLFTRLWWVQVRKGPEFVESIVRQSVRDIRVPAVRGRIRAGNGAIIADNRPSFDLVLNIEELKVPGPQSRTVESVLKAARSMAWLIGREPSLTEAQIRRHMSWYPALPLTLIEDLNKREITLIVERSEEIRGLEIRPGFRRIYPFPGLASHILGFTAARYPPDEGERRRYSYFEREPHGRSGLELYYDAMLSGTPGRKTVRVDTLGYVREETAREILPESGATLTLELDLAAQTLAERLLSGHTGALVLMSAETGGIIAMASSPTYSLTDLSGRRYAELASDSEGRPLLNRALAGGYLPGSIVKPLIALAAMEAGVLDPHSTRINCPGYYRLGDTRIRCARRSGHGWLTLVPALAQSCNTFFIALGQEAHLEALTAVFSQAGLGTSPGIDLPGGGDAGLAPTREWARRRLGREWGAADTAFISIGQGNISLSPLQAAVYAAAIGNGGAVLQPRLARDLRAEDGQLLKRFAPSVRGRLASSPEELAVVRKGMDEVVNSAIGGAPLARNTAISIAGKTGTAEVGPAGNRHKNAWFIGFAPVQAPKYAFAVVIERGRSGGRSAAPLIASLFEQWNPEN